MDGEGWVKLNNPLGFPPPPLPAAVCAVYSYGMCLWELSAGQTPFVQDPKTHSLVWRPSFPSLPPGTPPQLADLITRCLSAWPDRRPGWGQVLQALARCSGQARRQGGVEPPGAGVAQGKGVEEQAVTEAGGGAT